MSKQKRLHPDARKGQLIAEALDLAAEVGYTNVTRDQIALAAGVTGTAVQYHFKTMGQLRVAIMRAAVKQRRLSIIAQGLSARDEHALKADEALRREAAEGML